MTIRSEPFLFVLLVYSTVPGVQKSSINIFYITLLGYIKNIHCQIELPLPKLRLSRPNIRSDISVDKQTNNNKNPGASLEPFILIPFKINIRQDIL